MVMAMMTAHLASQISLCLIEDPNVPGRKVVFCGQTKIGSICETTYRLPSMRYQWTSADDRYGCAPDVAECLVRLAERAPGVIAEMEREAARRAEFDAKPAHVQAAILDVDKAQREYDRENHRVPVREDDLDRAEARLLAAKARLADIDTVINPVAELAA